MTQYSAAVCNNGDIVSVSVVDPKSRAEDGKPSASQVWSPDVGYAALRPRLLEVDRYCGKCGARVITACEECESPIPSPDVLGGQRSPAAFCNRCGVPYPWATREQRIRRLVDLLDSEEQLDESQRLEVVEAIDILAEPEDEGESAETRVKAGDDSRESHRKRGALLLQSSGLCSRQNCA